MQLGNKQFYWTLAILTLLLCISMFGYRYFKNQSNTAVDFAYMMHDTFSNKSNHSSNYKEYKTTYNNSSDLDENIKEVTYFKFDPNTVSKEDLIKLGIKPKVAQTIVNYRNKGGKFYKPQDFSKIYTLTDDDYQRLLPYIQIESKYANQSESKDYGTDQKITYQPKTNHPININTADESVWEKQKGIGPGFAKRIVAYKNRLGGFRYKEQLKEVYGLPDSTYQNLLPYLQVNNADIIPFSINDISEEVLANHPYIGPKMANNIIKLRTDLGKFNKIEDLKMVPLINEEKYRKIAQYFKVD